MKPRCSCARSGNDAPGKSVSNDNDRWLRTEREERIWQTLRTWRKKLADEHNVPAYAVFSDKTLRELTNAARKAKPSCAPFMVWAR